MSSSSPQITVRRLWLCIVVTMLSACGHEQVRRVPEPGARDATVVAGARSRVRSDGERAAVYAVRQIGVPYVYGGSSVRGFDCSGLVQYAWSKAGKRIPRTTREQWRRLTPVANRDLRVGDLLFFRIDGSISHVGLYLGDRRFVHSPSSGREVEVEDLDAGFYRNAFVRGARP